MAKDYIVRIGTEVSQSDLLANAKKLGAIIDQGISSEAKKSSGKYIKIIEDSIRKMEVLEKKRTLDRSDYENLNLYISKLYDSVKQMEELTSKVVAAPTQAIKDMREELNAMERALETRVSGMKNLFKERFGMGFDQSAATLDKREEYIKQQEDELNDLLAKERVNYQERLEARNLYNQQVLKDQDDLIKDAISKAAEETKSQIDNLEQFYTRIKDIQAEIASIDNEELRKEKAYVLSAKALGASQQQLADLERIRHYKYGEKSLNTRIANVGVEGVGSVKDIDKLHESIKAGLKTQETALAQRKKALLAEQAILKTMNEQIAAAEKVKAATKVLTKDEIADQAEKGAVAATAKDFAELEKAKQEFQRLKEEIDKLRAEIEDARNKFEQEKQARESQMELEQKTATENLLKDVPETAAAATVEVQKFADATENVGEELNKAEAKSQVFGRALDGIYRQMLRVTSVAYLMRKAIQTIQKGVNVVREIDRSLAEISFVTHQTTQELWQDFDKFNREANKLSTTTRNYLEGARIFYQQGMKTAEVMQMVEATTMAAALSSVSFADASETLTAAIRAYNMEASMAGSVTDKFAAVGAASAANFRELSVAMEKVASSAYAAGMSFDSLLGILAKGIETTREAPSAIGTALKTIIARFQELKEDPTTVLEDGVDVNRVEKALASVGVALRDSSKQFRDLDDVFADLGETWKTLDRNQKAYIATIAAGSRQQSRFIGIMNNYDRTLELIRISTNSAGEATRQFAVYETSLEAAQNRLTNSMETFYASLVDRGTIEGFTNFANSFVGFLTNANPKVVLLGTAIGILILAIIKYAMAVKIARAAEGDILSTIPKTFRWIQKLILAKEAEVTVEKARAAAIKATNIAMMSSIAIIAAAVLITSYSVNKSKERRRALKEEADELQRVSDREKEKASNMQALLIRYTELDLKINKTNEEQEEYSSLIQQLIELNPDFVGGINAQGEAYLKTREQLEDYLDAQKKLSAEAKVKSSKKRLEAVYAAKPNYSEDEGNLEESVAAYKEFETAMRKAQLEGVPEWLQNLTPVKSLDHISKNLFDIVSKGGDDAFTQFSQFLTAGMMMDYESASEEQKERIDRAYQLAVRLVEERDNAHRRGIKQLEQALRRDQAKKDLEDLRELAEERGDNMNTLAIIFDQVAIDSATLQGRAGGGRFLEGGGSSAAGGMPLEDGVKSQINRFDPRDLSKMLKEMIEKNPLLTENFEELLKEVSKAETPQEKRKILEKFNEDNAEFLAGIPEGQRKATEKILQSMGKVIFNEEYYKKQLESLVKTYQKLGGTMSDITVDNLSESFEVVPDRVRNFLVSSLDNMDDKEIKKKYIEVMGKMFEGASPEEIAERVDFLTDLVDNTDFSDPYAAFQFKEKFVDFLSTSLKIPKSEAEKIVKEMNLTGIILTEFINKVKDSYAEIAKLEKFIEKSASGLSAEDTLEIVSEYGAQAIELVGATAILTGQAIEAERKKINLQVEKDMNSYIGKLKEQQKELLSNTESGTLMTQQDKEQLSVWQAQEKQAIKLKDALTQLTEADLSRLANQNLLTGINAVVATASSLKDLAATYQQLNDGGFTQLEIMDKVANNPDYLQFLEVENNKLVFNKNAIEAETQARIDSMKVAVQERRFKVEAIIMELERYLAANEIEEESDRQRAEKAIDALQAESKASEMAYETLEAAMASTSEVVDKLDAAQQEAHLNQMKRIQAEINAYQAMWEAMRSGAAVTIAPAGTNRIPKFNAEGAKTDSKTAGSWVEMLGSFLGVEGDSQKAIAETSLGLLKEEKKKLDALEAQINQWKPKDFLEQINEMGSKTKDKKGGKESVFDAFFGEFDKYFNYVQKIEGLSKQISKLNSEIDLLATGGGEDLRLIDQKTTALAQQTDVLEQLIAVRQRDLQIQRIEMKQKYGQYVYFEEEQIKVRWDLINALHISTEAQKEWYEGMKESIDKYVEINDAIHDNTEALIANKKVIEDLVKDLQDTVVSTREQIYQALQEIDQREIADTKEKYDKMKSAQNDYLKAVKAAIDKERQMREDSDKKEELEKKRRKLAVLDRDTSGVYATQAEQLRSEIQKDELSLRDTSVDRQYEELQKQYEVMQKQYDLQVQSLEQQMALRIETGFYWQETDRIIAEGASSIVSVLTGTKSFMESDPFKQDILLGEIQHAAETVHQLYELGQQTLSTQDQSVVDAINAGIAKITEKKASETLEILSAIGRIPTGSTSSPSSSSGGSGSGTTASTSAAKATSTQSDANVKEIQKRLGIAVDGKFGPATGQALMDALKKEFLANGTTQELNMLFNRLAPAEGNKLITDTVLQYVKRFLPHLYPFFSTAPAAPWSYGSAKKFERGGMVDYTGPAWVDGTPSDPEAFLNAKQTAIFADLRDGLEGRFSRAFGGNTVNNPVSFGDINIELSNPTNADPAEIARLVRKEILNTYQNRMTVSIQRTR